MVPMSTNWNLHTRGDYFWGARKILHQAFDGNALLFQKAMMGRIIDPTHFQVGKSICIAVHRVFSSLGWEFVVGIWTGPIQPLPGVPAATPLQEGDPE